jgi:carbon monoxide dehydrogenase subunit G
VQLDNEFTVRAPLEQTWAYMLDVEKIAPCAPGAELTEVVDDRTWKGKMNVKLGPVSMSFAGTVTMQERDDAAHRAVLKAEGREQKGRGAASALVTARLEEAEEGTKVSISTDLTISGAAAQYGRGMIGDVSKRLTGQFASCLQERMGAQEASESDRAPAVEASAPSPADSASVPVESPPVPAGSASAPAPARSAEPVKGLRLAVWALWRAFVRTLRRLFRRPA